jgi:hypothetical protein
MRTKQPLTGVIATALVIAISLAFIACFEWPTFRDWVSYYLICTIPFAFVVGAFWHGEHPRSFRALPQPWRGLAFLVLALAVGAVVAVVQWATIGGGVTPPTVMVAQCIIISVPITFFLAVVWGGWPFTAIRRPLVGGIVLLLSAYVITDVLFRLLFRYEAMKGSPVYVASLDPQGRFDAWTVLVFIVTCMAAALLLPHVELWPLSLRPRLMSQPLLGVCWTAIAMAVSGLAMFLGIHLAGMTPPQFLTTVTVPFLFGSIVVLNMLEHSVFPRWSQPGRGLASAALAAVVGVVLARIYVALCVLVTGDVPWGPPGFQGEVWLASALLAVTFPFLAFHADFFGLWPVRRDDRPVGAEPASAVEPAPHG